MSRVLPDDKTYPRGLQDLEGPPGLWVIGNLPETPAVAVVGTRMATSYGLGLARAFGAAIARSGWSTISGLARGVDTAAHEGAIPAGGHTTAILGCGADVCYPRNNRPLYDSIIGSGGSIVSEYAPGTLPDRWRFPARNRLIAAMSDAVVVVEAGETGGALITARLGAETGRPVFVVPGDVDRQMSKGCNRLLRDGAHPVLGAADLIEELSLVVGPPQKASLRGGELPAEGLLVEDLPALWGLSLPEALARLGHMELEGVARRVGDKVIPV